MTHTVFRAMSMGVIGALLLTGCQSGNNEATPGGSPPGAGEESGSPAAAATSTPEAEPYYAGEQITVTIPFAEGGGTDVWVRFLTPYLKQAIPGGPSIAVKNEPGGESITGTNQYVAEASADGLEVLATSGSTVFPFLLGRSEVAYDFVDLQPIVVNGTGGVIYASPESGLESAADLAEAPAGLKYGGISETGLDLAMLVVFDLFAMDVATTFGFEGRGPTRLAFERGEVNLDYQTTSAYTSSVQPMIDAGKAAPLMSFGVIDESGEIARDPNFPDLPTVPEAYEEAFGEAPSGPAYEAYRTLMATGFVYQKALWVPVGTPEEALIPYYEAVAQLQEDSEFQTKAGEALGGYPLYAGDAVEATVRETFALSEEVRTYLLDLLESYGVTIQ